MPKFFYIYNKICRVQQMYPFFSHFFFCRSGVLPKRKKPEEFLELMTRAIQNTGLLWPLRARSQPPCRFYFGKIRGRFETLHEHPRQQFDDAIKLPYTTNLRRALMGVLIKDALISISLGNFTHIYTRSLSCISVHYFGKRLVNKT